MLLLRVLVKTFTVISSKARQFLKLLNQQRKLFSVVIQPAVAATILQKNPTDKIAASEKFRDQIQGYKYPYVGSLRLPHPV